MLRIAFSTVVSLCIVLLIGPRVLEELRKLKFGQTIYELGPAHQQKQGTPIMGGTMMVIAVFCTTLILHPLPWNDVWDFAIGLLALSLLNMLIGLVDDYTKVAKKRNLGLTARQKLFGQVFVAVAFSCYCYFHPLVGSSVIIPFVNTEWDLGPFYLPIMTLLIMFIVNSSNLQDGLDGLLSSVTTIGGAGWGLVAVCMALTASSSVLKGQYQTLAVFALALTGAAMGFLRFNYYPAKVFMGDMGSMFIGGATVGLALLLRQPFLLLFIFFTPILSSVSVILQRYYFKFTRIKFGEGRRIFKMAPIHHHFEKCGMTETQIIKMYGIVTAVLTILAVASTNLPLN